MKKSIEVMLRILEGFNNWYSPSPTAEQIYHIGRFIEELRGIDGFKARYWRADLMYNNRFKIKILTRHEYRRQQAVSKRAICALIYSIDKNITVNPKSSSHIIPIRPLRDFGFFRNKEGYDFLTIQGIYFLYNKNKLVYIGSSTQLTKRIYSHYLGSKIEFDGFKVMAFPEKTMSEIRDVEYSYIYENLPIYNIQIQK